jgi:hypothetical protein
MYDFSKNQCMPIDLKIQDDELHQKQLDALDRYDFVEALVLLKQQATLRDNWNKLCVQTDELVGVIVKAGDISC